MLKPRIHLYSPAYLDYQDHVVSKNWVTLVENARCFSLSEKIELLALFIGKKMTTELYMNIPFHLENEREKADEDFLLKLEKEVNALGLPFYLERFTKLNRASGKQREFVWFQVSRTQVINDYLQKNENRLSDADYGVLYCFPTTQIQAFLGFIPHKILEKKSIGNYYFGGVYSQDYCDEEQEHFDKVWEEISILSPLINQQAQKHYSQSL